VQESLRFFFGSVIDVIITRSHLSFETEKNGIVEFFDYFPSIFGVKLNSVIRFNKLLIIARQHRSIAYIQVIVP
jgi:hypothetical protein